ncbi:TATA-box-binding protein-like [Denticeps clupeoides]|uniref:TATA-box-binding protein-like n=1 Tax=Denticeps clupeoides TaxID=299321 RepID=UPI0010A541CE|nr:TATA-box-binding protein-like [Denticeps clupeoides]
MIPAQQQQTTAPLRGVLWCLGPTSQLHHAQVPLSRPVILTTLANQWQQFGTYNPALGFCTPYTMKPEQNTNSLPILQTQQQQQAWVSSNGGVQFHAGQTPQLDNSMATKTSVAKPLTAQTSQKKLSVGPHLSNVVSTFNIGCKLDLNNIARRGRNVEYNPRRFNAVSMKMRKPRTSALIFESGKIVCAGAQNEIESQNAARKYGRLIQKMGYPAKFQGFKIQNVVASCNVNFTIQIEDLAQNYPQECCYMPELFPGLKFRLSEQKLTLLVFISGKVVFVGAKSKDQVNKAFQAICPILERFKRKTH